MSDSFDEPDKKSAKVTQKAPKKGEVSPAPDKTAPSATLLRQSEFLKHIVLHRFNISLACTKTGMARKTFYFWLENDPTFAEQYADVLDARIDKWEECLHKNILAGDATSTIFALKTKAKGRGYSEKETANTETRAILAEVMAETITVRQAAYRYALLGLPLPEVLKIELSKQEPEPPPPLEPVSEEAMHAKFLACMENRDFQVNKFKPERIADIADLKESLKGTASFDPEKSDINDFSA